MKHLQRLRIQSKMTQRELAELTGVSQRSIEGYESGFRDINGAKGIFLWRIAQVLKCQIEDLLELEREKHEKSRFKN